MTRHAPTAATGARARPEARQTARDSAPHSHDAGRALDLPTQRPIVPPARCARRALRHRLVLKGALNASTAPRLEAEIERICGRGGGELTLDLARLVTLDWSGAMVLAFRSGWCRSRAVELVVAPGPRAVQRVLERTGVAARLVFEQAARGTDAAGEREPAGVGAGSVHGE